MIKGAVGIGLPTAAVGILSQGIDPRMAITLVVFPLLVANAWQVFRVGKFLRCLSDYRLFGVTLMIVLWLTTYITADIPETMLFTMIGSVIVIFTLTNLLFTPPAIPDRYDRFAQTGLGIVAGVLGGLTAIWAPPLVVYLVGRRVDKDEFVRATGLLVFLGSIPLCIGFWRAGLLTGSLAVTSMAMIAPSLAGFSLGELLRKRLSAERFRTIVLLVFLLMGLNLVQKAVF